MSNMLHAAGRKVFLHRSAFESRTNSDSLRFPLFFFFLTLNPSPLSLARILFSPLSLYLSFSLSQSREILHPIRGLRTHPPASFIHIPY